jgi:hypothetical protein
MENEMRRYQKRRKQNLDPEEFTTILTCIVFLFLLLCLMV